MDLENIIVQALAAGAAANFRPNVYESEDVVEAHFFRLKEMIEENYPAVDADLLDIGPGSKERQALLAQQLDESGAGDDSKLLEQAQRLLDAVSERLPNAVAAVSDDVQEIVSLDVDEAPQESVELDEETTLDLLREAQDERYADEIMEYTDDAEIRDDLMERQDIGDAGIAELEEDRERYTALSPDLSADDVDAAWEEANVAGEETVGGTTPTPDQDQVDELGEAAGLTYEDTEPLNFEGKMRARDEERWELDPASAEEEEEEELVDEV